ncbi:MAG: PadR family transcriptional regulator [Candidatus Thermoplasmatota archaeon]|nr:PadR family transcriptional regulator [Candidatus Thermoplasmatota archaeon]
MKSGLLSFLLLATIGSEKDPTYGYRIINNLASYSGGRYSLPEGTVYPILNQLSERGFLKTYWGDSKTGPRRKYYEITPQGRKAFEICLKEWKFINELVSDMLKNAGVEL